MKLMVWCENCDTFCEPQGGEATLRGNLTRLTEGALDYFDLLCGDCKSVIATFKVREK